MLVAFLLLAVVLEFFKLPIGGTPGFKELIGRCFIAILLLTALPEIMNLVAQATDSIAREIGDLSQFKTVLSRMGDRLKELSWSWTSVKDATLLAISFLSFFVLYVTVYFADGAFLYCWTLIYVFSPLVFALYVFPQTAGATPALFRSMLEVSLWKIAWAAMSTLLWSTALSDVNKPEYHVDFLSALVMNLMLALSVLVTPFIVRGFVGSGVATVSSSFQSALMAGAALTPSGVIAKARGLVNPLSRINAWRHGKAGEGDSNGGKRRLAPPARRAR
jgi:hypothetical protein